VHLGYQHKSIIVDESICKSFQGGMTGTSIYVYSYIVCFKCFLNSQCLLCQLWGFFKQNFIKSVAVIGYARLKMKSWFFAKTQSILYH